MAPPGGSVTRLLHVLQKPSKESRGGRKPRLPGPPLGDPQASGTRLRSGELPGVSQLQQTLNPKSTGGVQTLQTTKHRSNPRTCRVVDAHSRLLVSNSS